MPINNLPESTTLFEQKCFNELDKTLNAIAKEVQWRTKYYRRNTETRLAVVKLQNFLQLMFDDVESLEIQTLIKPFFRNIQKVNQPIQKAIYDEACYKIKAYIPNNIKHWDDIQKNFREWVIDDLLKGKFLEEAVTENLDLLKDNSSFLIVSVEELDNVISSENFLYQLYYDEFINAIDKMSIFEKTRLRERPEITFKLLLMKRIEGKTWRNISAEFDIKIGTLSSFYSRCLNKKFASFFKEFI